MWAILAALLSRLVQGMLGVDVTRVRTFVDDPIRSIVGTAPQHDIIIIIVVLAWHALGFVLVFKMGCRGPVAIWIGAELQVPAGVVIASVRQEVMSDVAHGNCQRTP